MPEEDRSGGHRKQHIETRKQVSDPGCPLFFPNREAYVSDKKERLR